MKNLSTPGNQVDQGAPSDAPAEPCAAWYELHGVAVYKYFRFQQIPPDDAEDLTAETFLRAVQAVDRYDPSRAAVQTWLLTIARNVLLDDRRSARVRRRVGVDELRDLALEEPSPEERMLRREEVGAAMTAMSALSPDDRELLSLRFGGELEIAELAALLRVPVGTVRTRVWRALERLREQMA
jgi:RNA polymerase sigma-70 factor (ECF subfamily)